MQCVHCDGGRMRLVRFQQRQEVYACAQCAVESLLLDCHYCERRSVRRLQDSAEGVARWACHRCQIIQHKCPACSLGWVLPNSLLAPEQTGFGCGRCARQWLQEADIKPNT